MSSVQWKEPPADLALLSDDIHIWRAFLDQPEACVQRLAQMLSADEQSRADHFHFERDRLRFIVGRGLLRTIFGRYLDVEPGRLRFCYSDYGKPSIDPKGFQNPAELALRFSLAHSHGLALYAITRVGEIGVDLEYIRPIAEADQIAERFFSARERAVFGALPASQKQEAFCNFWTRKEAYLKACGRGLGGSLDGIEVSLALGESARLLSISGDGQEASRWFLQALAPASGYVAAMVVERRDCLQPSDWQFKYWDL